MILVITEKPKVAKMLCLHLTSSKTCKGKGKTVDIYGIRSYEFKSDEDEVLILPLEGHITEMDSSDEYDDWRSSDPKMLITDEGAIVKYYTSIKHVQALKRLAPRTRMVILATDADEEGCAIGIDALRVVLKYNPSVHVKRLWLSTTQPEDVKRAWRDLVEPRYRWAEAVEARRRIDAMIGFSATRELTLSTKGFPTEFKGVLSVGRVQTALLSLLYIREREIREFKPKPYWNLIARIKTGEGSFQVSYTGNPIWSEEDADDIASKVKAVDRGVVKGVESTEEELAPPPPLNTTRMLGLISAKLGVSPSRAMKIAEDLYLNALITYPRTDTDKFTSFNHGKILTRIASSSSSSDIAHLAAKIFHMNPGLTLTRNGTRYLGDHEPVAPINVPHRVDDIDGRAWELIARRYLALFYPRAVLVNTKINVDIGGLDFFTRGRVVKDVGFLEVYGAVEGISTMELPRLSEGEDVRIAGITLRKQLTKPPKRYREAELMGLMEKHGIGTKSSRPEITSILKRRGYIEVRKGRIYITDLGYRLAELLNDVWGSFATPSFTRDVEGLMEKIKTGELDWRESVNIVRHRYLDLFEKLRMEKARLAAST